MLEEQEKVWVGRLTTELELEIVDAVLEGPGRGVRERTGKVMVADGWHYYEDKFFWESCDAVLISRVRDKDEGVLYIYNLVVNGLHGPECVSPLFSHR
jgi:hypothetical protein